jgi:hypothetical protein
LRWWYFRYGSEEEIEIEDEYDSGAGAYLFTSVSAFDDSAFK